MPSVDLKVGEASATDGKKLAAFVSAWLEEIKDSKEREKDFRKIGKEVSELYEAEDNEKAPYNILFSNTETLAPAVYNSLPRPLVKRRFRDADPMGKAACLLGQRTLEFLIDTDLMNSETYDEAMQRAVLHALVPGRGVTRFKYQAEFSQLPAKADSDENTEAEGEEEASEPAEKVETELVVSESVSWDKVHFGYAKKWPEVPWVCFECDMTRQELVDNFGEEVGSKVELVKPEETKEGGDSDQKGVELATVYEVWDKVKREIIFLSPGLPEAPLRKKADPIKLSGFFPMPKPLTFTAKINSMTPVALYQFYRQQAEELNIITTRITKIIRALKVRGFYDSTIEGLDKVMQAEDNILVPAENVAALQQGQTLEKAIFLMPIDKLVGVLQQLYAQRQQVKSVIFEITGIADIMRGSSVASETLGAQEIKNRWGTLRLKKAQKAVSTYARDSLRIMLELAVKRCSPETLKSMTGLPFPTEAQKQQAQALAQRQLMYAQSAAAPSPTPPAAEGSPAPAPQLQLPPEIQKLLELPTIESLQALLRDDLQRAFRVDVETNSTVDTEATEDKQDMAEVMNAISQFLNGVAPAVSQGFLPFEAAKALLIGIVKIFRFGDDVEEILQSAQPPQPQAQEPPDPTKSPEYLQQQAQITQQQQAMELQKMQRESEIAAEEHAMKMKELQQKAAYNEAKFQQDMAKLQFQAANPPRQSRGNPAGITGK